MSNAAIYFAEDAFDTSREKLMGRHAAGEGFLRALVSWGSADTVLGYCNSRHSFERFTSLVSWAGRPKKRIAWIPFERPDLLSKAGCLFFPSPGITELAWTRRRCGNAAYSITGITHTTASEGALNSIAGLLLGPIEEWDAVICTSQAVHDMVVATLDKWYDHLAQRLAASRRPRPNLPVIPLGVDCDFYDPGARKSELRRAFRQSNGVGDEDLVVLFLGRLSFHAKANPLPMYLALEGAARRTGRKVVLILGGWFANRFIENAFMSGASRFCPSIRVIAADARVAETRESLWAAADIFTSLSDNIQETFGMTPTEAMAAGLPAVVSDWDGYRDTVEHGVTGFRVATATPPPPLGADMAWRHQAKIENYDTYIGSISQLIAVDVAECEEAYARLFANDDLRREMGEAGRRRARVFFDWRSVIKDYEALWSDLADRRRKNREVPTAVFSHDWHPLMGDPFSTFRSYPTVQLDDRKSVSLVDVDRPGLEVFRAHPLSSMAGGQIAFEECADVLTFLRQKRTATVAEILDHCASPDRRAHLHRALLWLIKIGYLMLSPTSLESA